MRSRRLGDRLGALSGLLFAVLLFAGLLIGDPNRGGAQSPNPSEPSAEVARALAAHRDEALLGARLALVGTFFLFWFLGYLRHHLRRAGGEREWPAEVAFGGGLVAAGLILVGLGYAVATAALPDSTADPQVAKTLFVLGWNHLAVVTPALAALVGGTTAATLRSGALPRWLGWLGVVVTLLLLSPTSFLGYLAFFIWTAATSLVLLIGTQPPRPERLDRE